MALGPQEQQVAILKDLHGIVQSLSGQLSNLERKYAGVTGSVNKASDSAKKMSASSKETADSVNKMGKEADDSSKKLTGLGRTFEGVQASLVAVSGASKAFGTALRLPISAAEKFQTMFQKSFQVVSEFQNAVYLGSQKLNTFSLSFNTTQKAQEQYNKQLDKLRQGTSLTSVESEKMMKIIVDGFRGVKSEANLDIFSKVAGGVANLNMDLGKSIHMMQQLVEPMNKFAEVRKMMASTKDVGSFSSSAAMLALKDLGAMSQEQFDNFAQYQKSVLQTGGRQDQTGRKATIQLAGVEQARGEAGLKIATATTEQPIAQQMMQWAKGINNWMTENARIVAAMNTTAGLFDELSKVTA